MVKALLVAQTALVLCCPVVEACADGEKPYLPWPRAYFYSNPKAYKADCAKVKARHQKAVQKAQGNGEAAIA